MALDIWFMFVAAAFLNIISPGPAIVLAVSNGITSGSKVVAVSSLGNILGLLLMSTISMFGLGIILKTSALLFTVLKIIGAGYLIYLGLKKFNDKSTFLVDDNTSNVNRKLNYMKKCKEGFFIASTNPKAILFFVAFFPIFLDTSAPVLPQFIIMTLTFMIISFISLMTYGYIAKSARSWFKNQNVIKIFHKLTGGIFIGFGIALLRLRASKPLNSDSFVTG